MLTNLGYNYKAKVYEDGKDEYIEEFVEPPQEKVCKYFLFGPCPSVATCVTST